MSLVFQPNPEPEQSLWIRTDRARPMMASAWWQRNDWYGIRVLGLTESGRWKSSEQTVLNPQWYIDTEKSRHSQRKDQFVPLTQHGVSRPGRSIVRAFSPDWDWPSKKGEFKFCLPLTFRTGTGWKLNLPLTIMLLICVTSCCSFFCRSPMIKSCKHVSAAVSWTGKQKNWRNYLMPLTAKRAWFFQHT